MYMSRTIRNRGRKLIRILGRISIRRRIMNETRLISMLSYRISYRVRRKPIKLFMQLYVIYGKELIYCNL